MTLTVGDVALDAPEFGGRVHDGTTRSAGTKSIVTSPLLVLDERVGVPRDRGPADLGVPAVRAPSPPAREIEELGIPADDRRGDGPLRALERDVPALDLQADARRPPSRCTHVGDRGLDVELAGERR
jgi:hypothetical protein